MTWRYHWNNDLSSLTTCWLPHVHCEMSFACLSHLVVLEYKMRLKLAGRGLSGTILASVHWGHLLSFALMCASCVSKCLFRKDTHTYPHCLLHGFGRFEHQASRLHHKCIFPLSHLPSPVFLIFNLLNLSQNYWSMLLYFLVFRSCCVRPSSPCLHD